MNAGPNILLNITKAPYFVIYPYLFSSHSSQASPLIEATTTTTTSTSLEYSRKKHMSNPSMYIKSRKLSVQKAADARGRKWVYQEKN